MTPSMRKDGQRIHNGKGTNRHGAPFSSSSNGNNHHQQQQHQHPQDQYRKKLGRTTKQRKQRTVLSSAILTILVLSAIEVVAYLVFTLPPEHQHQHPQQYEEFHHLQQQQQQQQQNRDSYRKAKAKEVVRSTPLLERRPKQPLIQAPAQAQPLTAASVSASVANHVDQLLPERIKTLQRLQRMGVTQQKKKKKKKKKTQQKKKKKKKHEDYYYNDNSNDDGEDYDYSSNNDTNFEVSELPPWSQIVQNWNSKATHNNEDEPVILGLDKYCAPFRAQHQQYPRQIRIGPTGLFSTGTNLIAALLRNNCHGPTKKARFAINQVPWGKHNPASARTNHFQVKAPIVPNFEAVLPIVAIRHPYTWMSAMCKHSYNTRWHHKREACDKTLQLTSPIVKVPYGYKNHTNTYPSLAHMWKYWYKEWYLETRYHQSPRIMVRHEDLVFRPEKVITPICECVGGTITQPFIYEEQSANRGKGHGNAGRSGLIDAVIKYGQPLHDWYVQYNNEDRAVLRTVLQGNYTYNSPHVQYQKKNINTKNTNNNRTTTTNMITYTIAWNKTTTKHVIVEDPEEERLMREIYDTFQYTLYDELHRPDDWEEHLNPILNKKPLPSSKN